MKKLTIKQIKSINTFEDLKAVFEPLGVRAICDISHRGGGVGLRGSDLATLLRIYDSDLPKNYGAGCNYLGGGVRGAIFPSGYNVASVRFFEGVAEKLDAIAEACIRVYRSVEKESVDGDEWNDAATEASRQAGIRSAY